ncbi:MAG: arabinose efflux permease family protein [Actinomycetia bacterium]|nr:arabinose efflux permease family protein [Actinomycetes bacterium]
MTADGGVPAMFAALRIPSYRRFYVGQFSVQVGVWLTMIASALLVYDRTESAAALGLLTVCQFLPLLALGSWAGVIADRNDKRRVLIAMTVLGKANSAVLGIYVVAGGRSLVPVYVLAVVWGVALAFESPPRRTFVAETVPVPLVANAIGLYSAMMVTARILGPALAGLLISVSGYGACFLLDAATGIVLLAALVRIDPATLRRSERVVKGKGQVREGLRYLRSVPELWMVLVMTTIIGVLAYNFTVVFPPYVEDTLRGDHTAFTLLFSTMSVGALLGALWTSRRGRVEARDLVVSAVCFGAALALLTVAPNLAFAYVVSVGLGISSNLFFTMGSTIVQVEAAPAMQGRVIALHSLVTFGSTPVGGLFLGLVCDTLGSRVAMGIGAVAAVVAAGIGSSMARRATPPLVTVSPGVTG